MSSNRTKTSLVKEYFENSSKYLGIDGRTIGILSRQQIVKAMLKDMRFKNLLDVPCGNGLISLALADQAEKLTLVDIAESMIEHAKSNAPTEHSNKISFKHGNIFDLKFQEETFDCVLAIGILAHVEVPSEFIDQIDKLLCPNGTLILQTTDHSHVFVRLQKILRRRRVLVHAGDYDLNPISHRWLVNYLIKKQYKLVSMYRYETKIPFAQTGNLDQGLNAIWSVFGMPPNNRLAFLGSKCIYKFAKMSNTSRV